MKIGILGGTFNPIHVAHLRIAEEVRERFGLERIIFVPAATPPHKPLAGELAFEDRFAMVRAAIAGNPSFAISDIEGQRGGKSFLIDTLRQIRADFPEDEIFFIMGSDSFVDISNWKDYTEYFSLVNIIVVERPGVVTKDLLSAIPVDVAGAFTWFAPERRLAHCSGYSIYFFQGTLLDISSSNIRQLVSLGHSITYLVPEPVEEFIKTKRLYCNAC